MEQQHRRGVQRVRHELHIRDVSVARIAPLGDSFLAITFQGEALAQFTSLSFDDHVKVMFDLDGEQLRRDFTPLHYDLQQRALTLEFALHEDGASSIWARAATVGQRAIIGGPRGSMVIPIDYDWHLLAGDRSALPAIRRRLAELPAGARVIALIHAGGGDRLALETQADLSAQWVDSDAELVAALRALQLPAGEGFVWFAGEAATAKAARAVLLDEKGMHKDTMRVSAYWKQGVADHHENLE